MVNALGWSSDIFDPTDPGRLCRGRERWIESFPIDPPPEMFRVVISSATFSDDSARDADRGLSSSGIGPEQVIDTLFGGFKILAWCEDGHPAKLPQGAIAVEEYQLRRPYGPLQSWRVRWTLPCDGPQDIITALQAGADCITVHGDDDPGANGDSSQSPLDRDGQPRAELRDAVFLLCGSRLDGQPLRRFQPVAIIDVLKHADVLILAHQDKHAPCLGIYSLDELDPGALLDQMVEGTGALSVPFAIPPMLARWDRALWELRQDWDEDMQGPFPVPPAPEGSWGWGRRQRQRGRAQAEE